MIGFSQKCKFDENDCFEPKMVLLNQKWFFWTKSGSFGLVDQNFRLLQNDFICTKIVFMVMVDVNQKWSFWTENCDFGPKMVILDPNGTKIITDIKMIRF